jgi:hypothetical protein
VQYDSKSRAKYVRDNGVFEPMKNNEYQIENHLGKCSAKRERERERERGIWRKEKHDKHSHEQSRQT